LSPTARTLPLAIYATASGLLEPIAPALLRARARRGKEDTARLGERLGRASLSRPDGPLVWLHGVSVGESLSLLPLVAALKARRPDIVLLVTSGTVTSAEVLARRLPAGVLHQFAPVDGPRAVGRFLDHWRPDLALLVESELWPNLILAARGRGVRLALLSARMTEASAAGWGRAPATARALLSAFDLVLPQDSETETRLAALGAQVGPRLNLKLAAPPPPVDSAERARLAALIGDRKVVLAASTHPGEDALIARAFGQAVIGGPPALLVVAPRHPARGDALADELAASGLNVARRSLGEPPGPQIGAYLADTLGELGLFLALADAVVMGGSFVEGIGGHNPLEPAHLGRAIVTGPHAFNARGVYQEMFADAAAIEAADEAALARHIRGLLEHPRVAGRIGAAALAYARRQGRAIDDALARLEPLLPA
jgi:3-deoxy-D-manno-octulosonic-acid transferase